VKDLKSISLLKSIDTRLDKLLNAVMSSSKATIGHIQKATKKSGPSTRLARKKPVTAKLKRSTAKKSTIVISIDEVDKVSTKKVVAKAVKKVEPLQKKQSTAKKISKKPIDRQGIKPVPAVKKASSANINQDRQEKTQQKANNKGFFKSLAASFSSVTGKITGQVRELTAGKGGVEQGRDAVGMAAGGPVWGAIKEMTEFVSDVRGERSMTGRIVGNLFKRFAGRKAAADTPEGYKPDKNGKLRDKKGHFLKGSGTVEKSPDKKQDNNALFDDLFGNDGQKGKPAGHLTRKSKKRSAEQLGTVTDSMKVSEKAEKKRHKELLSAVKGIDADGDGGLLGNLKGGKGISGKIKGLLGLGAAGGVATKGGGILSKVLGGGKKAMGAVKGLGGKALGKVGGKGALKGLGKAGGKSLLKKIPVLGLLAGGGFAIQRLMKGDMAGALGELSSGAASMVPGLGTAASVAIDAGLVARDLKNGEADETVTPHGPDTRAEIEQIRAAKKNKSLNKGKKKTLQAGTVSGKKSSTVPGKIGKTVLPVSPIKAPAVSKAPATQSQPAAAKQQQPVIVIKNAEREKEKKKSLPHNIPTEYDDTVLTLMAHDRL
jgi:hypothetical protein